MGTIHENEGTINFNTHQVKYKAGITKRLLYAVNPFPVMKLSDDTKTFLALLAMTSFVIGFIWLTGI